MTQSGNGGNWDKAVAQKLNERDAAAQGGGTPPRKRRTGLKVLGALGLGTAVLVALAPTIGGSLAPGLIESKAGSQIAGLLKVDKVSLSWAGPQVVGPLTLSERGGASVARVTISVSKSLLGLATGGLDLGTIEISGSADVVREKDGAINLVQASKPTAPPVSPPPAAGPPSIPAGLKAEIVAKALKITYTDKAASPESKVTLSDVDLGAKIAAGQPLRVDMSARASKGSAGSATGTVAFKADVANWTDNTGLITADKADIDAKLMVKDMPSELVDALAGGLFKAGALQRGLGETVNLDASAKGTLKSAAAQLTLAAQRASAGGGFKIADGVLTSDTPFTLRAEGRTLSELAPQIQQALSGQDALKLDAIPDLELSVDKVRFKFPQGGKPGDPVDLRGSAADIKLTLKEAKGTLKLDPAGAPEPFVMSGLNARIETADLSSVRLTSNSVATIAGRPAGNVDVDFTIGGLLDASGAPVKGLPSSLRGKAEIKGIATAIAQPFVRDSGLDLPNDIGQRLDVSLIAATIDGAAAPAGGGAVTIPPTNIDLNVSSDGLRIAGALRLDSSGLITRDPNGLQIDVPRAGMIASRFVKPETGWELVRMGTAADGTLTARLTELKLPFKAGTTEPVMDKLEASLAAALANWGVRPLGAIGAEPIGLRDLRLNAIKSGAGAPRAELNGAGDYAGQAFTMTGRFDLPGLFSGKKPTNNPLLDLSPNGKLELKSLPTAIVRAVTPKPAANAPPSTTPAPDLAAVLRDQVGPSINATVVLANGPNGSGEIVVNLLADHLASDIKAQVYPDRLDLPVFVLRNEVTPRAFETLLRQFAPDLLAGGGPKLVNSPVVSVQVEPLSIPLVGLSPKLDRVGDATVKIGLGEKVLIDGLTMADDSGGKRSLGVVGIEGMTITAKAAVGSLVGATPGDLAATIAAGILGADQRSIGSLAGDIKAKVASAQPAGRISAKLDLRELNTVAVENILGKPGLVSGAIGETLTAQTTTDLTPPAGSDGKPFAIADAVMTVETSLRAPRLRTDGPIKAAIRPDRINLLAPANLQFDAAPAWVNAFLEPKPDPATGRRAPAAMTLNGSMPVQIALSSLSIARGAAVANVGPLKPGVFDLALKLLVSGAEFVLAADPTAKPSTPANVLRLSALSVDVRSDPKRADESALAFDVGVGDATVVGQPGAKNLKLAGRLDRIAGPDGAVDIKNAALSADGDLAAIPTALVDAIANQQGLLVDALGPTTSLRIKADRLSLAGAAAGGPARSAADPQLDLAMTSNRASARIRGTTAGSVFVAETPVEVSVTEVTEALAARFVKGLPSVGSFQKSREDTPAMIVGSGLRVPLDNDLSKLNGELRINPGSARFGTSSAFGKLLNAVKIRDAGMVGRRLEPLTVTVTNGLVTYPKYKLPLGEFTIESEGRVDLAARQIDVVTWVPFGALADEVAGLFKAKAGLGAALGKIPGVTDVTLMPIRTTGSLDNPKTQPDMELFLKNVVGGLTSPEKTVEQIGDLLGDLLKKPKK